MVHKRQISNTEMQLQWRYQYYDLVKIQTAVNIGSFKMFQKHYYNKVCILNRTVTTVLKSEYTGS